MKTTDHLFVSSTDGGLYDTRKANWHRLPAVRANYCRSFSNIKSTVELKATIRAGEFAWPGGYPLYLITQDCAALCFACARKEWRQLVWDYLNKCDTGWKVVGCAIHEEGELFCDHCSKLIE